MIRPCDARDFESIYEIINDGARAYQGIIPEDRWSEPYMSRSELQHEIDEGVTFWGYEANGNLAGVMGIQPVRDVTFDSARICPYCRSEARHWSAAAITFADVDSRPGIDRNLGSSSVGDPLLRKARLSDPKSAAERPLAKTILEHSTTSGGNLRSSGRCEVVGTERKAMTIYSLVK
jgi:hypothetical protein